MQCRLIYRTTDSTIYRWTGSAWTAEVAATQIVGQLIAGQIAAGAIGTEQLAARAVAARHLLVSDFTNLVPDSGITDAPSWTNLGGWTIQNSGPAFTGENWTFADVSAGSTGNFMSGFWTVEAGKDYFASIQARSNGSGQTILLTVQLQWCRTDGSFIGYSVLRIPAQGAIPATVTTYSGSFVAPAEATSCRFIWTVAAPLTGRAYVGSPIVRLKNGGELIVDGTLKAQHIEFETLTGGLMAPSGIITKAAQIENAVIKNAHIDDATITGAKIANLTVDTINIKDRAITDQIIDEITSKAITRNVTNQSAHTMTITLAQPADIIFGGYLEMHKTSKGTGRSVLESWITLDGVELSRTRDTIQVTNIKSYDFMRTAKLRAGTHYLRIMYSSTDGYNGQVGSQTPANDDFYLRNMNLFVFRSYK